MKKFIYQSPFGDIEASLENESIVSLQALQERKESEYLLDSDLLAQELFSQLDHYFSGKLHCFDLPLSLQGTDFQRAVWQKLLEIPYGKTISYGEIAQELGGLKMCRAVGGACGKNPVLIVVPCHRVLGKTGALTGFAAGMNWKSQLLQLEALAATTFRGDPDEGEVGDRGLHR